MVKRKKAARRRPPAKKKVCCEGKGKHKIVMGVVLLAISALLYMGLGWMEIFGILGILAILKGLWLKRMK